MRCRRERLVSTNPRQGKEFRVSNTEVVNAFIEVLLKAPELTIQAVQMRLSTTRYEIKLLKAEPYKEADTQETHLYQFPFMTGEKGVDVR